MPARSCSERKPKKKGKETNQDILNSLREEIAIIRTDFDFIIKVLNSLRDEMIESKAETRNDLEYIKTITHKTYCATTRMDNHILLDSNSVCNHSNLHRHSVSHVEEDEEDKEKKKLKRVKSLMTVKTRAAVSSVSISSDSSVDSLLSSFLEKKEKQDEVNVDL